MNEDGVGLGLLLCKYLVENNQGKIEIFSEGNNCGAVVRFDMRMQLSIEN